MLKDCGPEIATASKCAINKSLSEHGGVPFWNSKCSKMGHLSQSTVTSARGSDRQLLRLVIDIEDMVADTRADSAYRSTKNEARLKANRLKSQIHRSKHKGTPRPKTGHSPTRRSQRSLPRSILSSRIRRPPWPSHPAPLVALRLTWRSPTSPTTAIDWSSLSGVRPRDSCAWNPQNGLKRKKHHRKTTQQSPERLIPRTPSSNEPTNVAETMAISAAPACARYDQGVARKYHGRPDPLKKRQRYSEVRPISICRSFVKELPSCWKDCSKSNWRFIFYLGLC